MPTFHSMTAARTPAVGAADPSAFVPAQAEAARIARIAVFTANSPFEWAMGKRAPDGLGGTSAERPRGRFASPSYYLVSTINSDVLSSQTASRLCLDTIISSINH